MSGPGQSTPHSAVVVSGRAQADLARCNEILAGGSRSFRAASLLLPARVRDDAAAVYAFCRQSDDAVDETDDVTSAVGHLNLRLDRIYADTPADDPVERALCAVLARTPIPKAVFEALIEGFQWDAQGRIYTTMGELEDYCARVASTVGVMMAALMGVRDRDVMARALDLGLGMQLTNIARDVGEDARNGRLYLPRDWLVEAGLDPEALLADVRFSPPLGEVVRRVLDHADTFYDLADKGISALPWDCRLSIRAARLIYSDIGRVIRSNGYDSISQRAWTSGSRKLWLVARALPAMVWRTRSTADPPAPAAAFLVGAWGGGVAPTTRKVAQGGGDPGPAAGTGTASKGPGVPGGPFSSERGPAFDLPVADGGYAWWYADGTSDDGAFGFTMIAFVGSVFSARYAAARARGPADPLDFCAFNLAVYGQKGRSWCLTEWPREAVERSPASLRIGSSVVAWEDGVLVVRFDERTVPGGHPVRGTLRLVPGRLHDEQFVLDAAGRHRWWPVAPASRFALRLEEPAMEFAGTAYHDTNQGDEPLEDAFRSWTWSRAHLDESTVVLYDRVLVDGSAGELGRMFRDDGTTEPIEAPQRCRLPRGRWLEPRSTRASSGSTATVARTLETSPFYARSLIETTLAGTPCLAIHEALSLERFTRGWVQFLLPYKTLTHGAHEAAPDATG